MLNVLLFISSWLFALFSSFRLAPIFGFVLYQSVYFYYPNNRWWGYMVPNLPYSFITVMFMFVLLAMNMKASLANNPLKSPILRGVLYIFLVMAAVSLIAVMPYFHDEAVINYLKLFVIISIAYMLCHTVKSLDYILYGYIFGSWYMSFMVYQVGRTAFGRVEGIGTVDSPEANGLAAAIAPSVILCVYYIWKSKSYIAKGMMSVAIVFTANALVLINSRASFLAVIASTGLFLCYMIWSRVRKKGQKAVAVSLILLGSVGAGVVADEAFISRMKTIFSDDVSSQQETGATRTEFWRAAIDVSFDYPFGLGTRGFELVSPRYIRQEVATGRSRNKSVHSSWFEVLTEIGYIGFLIFIALMFSCYRCLRKVRYYLKSQGDIDQYFKVIAIQCSLVSYLVCATFMNRYRAEILYWIILFVAVAYNLLYIVPNKEREESSVKSRL